MAMGDRVLSVGAGSVEGEKIQKSIQMKNSSNSGFREESFILKRIDDSPLLHLLGKDYFKGDDDFSELEAFVGSPFLKINASYNST
jgi:hypothetical protein